jgi:hypothetical protein
MDGGENPFKQNYYTEFNLGGEKIEVNVEEHFPLLKPIVSINRWQEDTGRNREIAKVIKSVLKKQNYN